MGVLIMSDLDDFMAQNKPTYRTKLQPYLSDIRTLYEHGYSEPDILRYLSEKKMLAVTRKTLHSFILKNIVAPMDTTQPQNAQNGIVTVQTTETPPKTETAPKQAGNVPNQSTQQPPQMKKGIKKFDWKNATTEGLI